MYWHSGVRQVKVRRTFLTLPEPNMGFEVLLWSFGEVWQHGVYVVEKLSSLQMCGVYKHVTEGIVVYGYVITWWTVYVKTIIVNASLSCLD